MADKPINPHFRYPFRFGQGDDKHALVSEQGTEEEIVDCVIAIVKTPTGFRDDIPDFGIPEPIFQQQPLGIDDIQASLDLWEDRASYLVTTVPDFKERLAAILTINVQTKSDI
jgi:hypothetical protein